MIYSLFFAIFPENSYLMTSTFEKSKPIQVTYLINGYSTMIIGEKSKPIRIFFKKTVIVRLYLPFSLLIFHFFQQVYKNQVNKRFLWDTRDFSQPLSLCSLL